MSVTAPILTSRTNRQPRRSNPVPTDSDVLAFPLPPSQGTFSKGEIEGFRNIDKHLSEVYKKESQIEVTLCKLHKKLPPLSTTPASGMLGRALTWISSGFGLLNSIGTNDREGIQLKISEKVLKLKTIHEDSLKEIENKIRNEHAGKIFKITAKTPEILKRLAIPSDKSSMSYSSLRAAIETKVSKKDTHIKIEQPSSERTIIHRQRADKTWESLELSWRRTGKVDVILNGSVIGNLYNDDALKGAAAFIKGSPVSLSPKKYPPDTLWKIV